MEQQKLPEKRSIQIKLKRLTQAEINKMIHAGTPLDKNDTTVEDAVKCGGEKSLNQVDQVHLMIK